MYRKQQYSIETPENLKNLFGGQLDEEGSDSIVVVV
jgi:hypothetical protein